MFNTRILQSVIAFAVGVFLAIWLGLNIVTEQTATVLKIIAAVLFIVCFVLGRRIWLLIPFAASLAIGLRVPGNPDALLLAQIAFIAFSIPQFFLRKLPWRLQFTELEFWMLMITVTIGQALMRNPVGLNVFGGDTVGGRGYVLYGIALASATILCGLRVPTSDLKWFVRLSITGGLMNLAISLMGVIVPAIGYYTGQSYTRTDEVNYENRDAIDTGAAGRIGFMTEFGKNLSLWISCYISPLLALVKPLWFMLIIVSVAASLMGGFRSGIIASIVILLLGIAYRSGGTGVLLSSFMGMTGIALLAAINLIAPLPPNAQRVLSFLPGTWEQRYKDDAEGSTEWRTEVWKEALLTDRWIHNKWLGDGIGFSAAELGAQRNQRKGVRAGISGFEAHRESILANGDYHSTLVSGVRTTGYIGTIVLILASIRLSIHAHRLIIQNKNTNYYPLSLLIGIPIVGGSFLLLIGSNNFPQVATSLIISTSIIRLFQNNIPRRAI